MQEISCGCDKCGSIVGPCSTCTNSPCSTMASPYSANSLFAPSVSPCGTLSPRTTDAEQRWPECDLDGFTYHTARAFMCDLVTHAHDLKSRIDAKHTFDAIQDDEILKHTMWVLGRMEYLKLLDVRGQLTIPQSLAGWINVHAEKERNEFQEHIRVLEARKLIEGVEVALYKMQKTQIAWRAFVIQMLWHGIECLRSRREKRRCIGLMPWKAMVLQMVERPAFISWSDGVWSSLRLFDGSADS